jgi:Parkin co-regulated protein
MKRPVTAPVSVSPKPDAWGPGPAYMNPRQPHLDPRLFAVPHVFEGTDDAATVFRQAYERGSLPVAIKHGAKSKLDWKVSAASVDSSLLPTFIDGLREKTNPYRYVATYGSIELSTILGTKYPQKVLPVLPDCVVNLKKSLATNDPDTIVNACLVIQALTTSSKEVAVALMQYYKLLLPSLGLWKSKKRCTFDRMDFSKRDGRIVGEIIEETLDILEETAGPDAFKKIKFIIPTFESTREFPDFTRSKSMLKASSVGQARAA